ncbi:hypothetical protein LWI29_001194 [Acer saccharum]|uniref:Reverse transcriptase zinc-binding domain-containing protein n=1 Tax=Acer saccharum TaxID=4024 RepID=A0AA39RP38_ACESA|nr:hypothetical protein LWI29_001194 [Acer saccharum]
MEDQKVWHFDKSNVFRVKSGYWVGRSFRSDPSQPSSYKVKDWWKKLWMLEIPLKIKLFIWKVCYDWIPTYVNLGRRGIKCNDKCPVCGKNMESTLHALWHCCKLKYDHVWWLPSNKMTFPVFLI